MDRFSGDQLSILAQLDYETTTPSTVWAEDTKETDDWEYERIRREYVARANGGQVRNPASIIADSGGQTSEPQPHIDTSGGQLSSGDNCLPPTKRYSKPMAILPPGVATWIEVDRRRSGDYGYQRWRNDGIKRSRYLGKCL